MGYDLHISKKNDWSEEGNDILKEDWENFVNSEKDISPNKYPDIFDWKGHSKGTIVPFYFSQGQIQVKDPDEEVLAKMKEISLKLGASVQGDDGELY